MLLVCNPGGHLQQMLALEPAWKQFECSWATLPGADVDTLLAGRDVTKGHGPTNRSALNGIRNFFVAWRVIRRQRPDLLLSTGAGLAVPFFLVGRLLGRRLIYVESLTRIDGLSLTGRIIYPFADEFFVQWPGAAVKKRMRYHGSIL